MRNIQAYAKFMCMQTEWVERKDNCKRRPRIQHQEYILYTYIYSILYKNEHTYSLQTGAKS